MGENTKTLAGVISAPQLPNEILVTLSQEAMDVRDDYLVEASFITQVTSQEEATKATQTVGKLKGFTKEVEKTREAVKKPFLEAGRIIDLAARTAVKPCESESLRIERLLSDYQKEQFRKIQEERIKREQELQAEQAKLAKLQKEQEEAARKAREAQEAALRAQREAEEAKSKKAKAEAEKAAAEAALKAQQAQQEAEAAADRSMEAAIDASEAPIPKPMDATIKGAATRPEYDYEITDLAALYEAHPSLVDLVPRKADIRRFINTPGAKHDIPGLVVREAVKVAVRAVSMNEASFLTQNTK